MREPHLRGQARQEEAAVERRRPEIGALVPGPPHEQVGAGVEHRLHPPVIPLADDVEDGVEQLGAIDRHHHRRFEPAQPRQRVGPHAPAPRRQQAVTLGEPPALGPELAAALDVLPSRRPEQMPQRRQIVEARHQRLHRAGLHVVVQERHVKAIGPVVGLPHHAAQRPVGRGVALVEQRIALVGRHRAPLADLDLRAEAHRRAVGIAAVAHLIGVEPEQLDHRVETHLHLALEKLQRARAPPLERGEDHERQRHMVWPPALDRAQHPLPRRHPCRHPSPPDALPPPPPPRQYAAEAPRSSPDSG